jgi:hypothetical protein
MDTRVEILQYEILQQKLLSNFAKLIYYFSKFRNISQMNIVKFYKK